MIKKNIEKSICITENKCFMIVYDRLWETMKRRGITKYYLISKCGISPSLITRLKKNKSIRMDTVNTLCGILDCNIEDIAEYIKE